MEYWWIVLGKFVFVVSEKDTKAASTNQEHAPTWMHRMKPKDVWKNVPLVKIWWTEQKNLLEIYSFRISNIPPQTSCGV